jgi:methylphosphotriester-DNA--protein-cysteine methyltransferase
MNYHQNIETKMLRALLRAKALVLAGNRKLKIYGRLDCISGKRMKKENRVFFTDESDALENGFRPCGHCLSEKYNAWKNASSGLKKHHP